MNDFGGASAFVWMTGGAVSAEGGEHACQRPAQEIRGSFHYQSKTRLSMVVVMVSSDVIALIEPLFHFCHE